MNTATPLKPKTTLISSNLAERLSWLVAVILVLLPFHAFLTTWAASNSGYLDIWRIWKEVLLVGLLLPGAVWLVWKRQQFGTLRRNLIIQLITIYAALHVLLGGWAYLAGHVNAEALIYALGINLRFLLFFVICAAIASSSGFLKTHWKKILLAPAAAVVTFGLVQKFLLPYDFLRHFGYGPDTIPAYQAVDNDLAHRRIQSFLRGANPLGSYLLIIILALLASWRKSSVARRLATAAAFTLLFYSYSRSAWLGLAVSLLALFTINLRRSIRPKKLFLALLTLMVVSIGLVYVLRDNDTAQNVLFHSSENSKSSQSSNAARLQSIEDATTDIKNQPYGQGPGTAGPASLRNDNHGRIAENYYLQIGQEIGIAGMVIFIAINLAVAQALWKRRTDELSQLLLVSLIGLSVVNFLSHAWADDTLSYIWWGLAGVALAPVILKKSKSEKINDKTLST